MLLTIWAQGGAFEPLPLEAPCSLRAHLIHTSCFESMNPILFSFPIQVAPGAHGKGRG